jgi:hypothetical protein
MRKYLQHHNELPDEPLAATMPLNMNTRGVTTTDNNNVGAMHSQIHTDIADPFERLLKINESINEAKQASDVSPVTNLLNIAGEVSPWLSQSVARMWESNHLSKYIPLNVCTNISNVPGPNFPMYCAGAKLIRYHGLGLLTPGIGTFHLVFSNNGVITITLLADRDIVPDPTFYRQCLDEAFAETLAAAKKISAQREADAEKQLAQAAKPKPKRKAKAKAKPKAKPKAKAKAKSTPAANDKAKVKARTKTKVVAKEALSEKPKEKLAEPVKSAAASESSLVAEVISTQTTATAVDINSAVLKKASEPVTQAG